MMDNLHVREVMMGLSRKQKAIPPKFLYDEEGSIIFEKICELPEYYPTRAEKEILRNHGSEICKLMGEDVLLIEPGSGNGEKVRLLLRKLSPKAYIPIEISEEVLGRMTDELREEFPLLDVIPICGDFTQNIELPTYLQGEAMKRVIFFPGSTIGNFNPHDAISFLIEMSSVLHEGGGFLIGVDLKKDERVIQRAYDDSAGVTAAFNLNLLRRLNREMGASFEIQNFHHEAFYNQEMGRIEMHLKSKCQQEVKVGEAVILFKEGETIHTENSYKYSTDEFTELAASAGLHLKKYWKDSKKLFCVYYLEKE